MRSVMLPEVVEPIGGSGKALRPGVYPNTLEEASEIRGPGGEVIKSRHLKPDTKPFMPERIADALGGKCICGAAQENEVFDLIDTLLDVEHRSLIEARIALGANLHPENAAGVRAWFGLADEISDRLRKRLELPSAGLGDEAEPEA